MKKRFKGGVAAPTGFLCSGLRAGIKQWARDLGLLYSTHPATCAALFTRSRLQGAPLEVTREHLKNGRLQAVIVNSGNANCCTGKRGLRDARRMAHVTARALGISDRLVAVCSTGAIGSYLPMERIERKIPFLVSDLSQKRHLEFAEAILTTDKTIKEEVVRFRVGQREATLGAVCKGAGMIHPRMATMLCFITTDLAIARKPLQSLLKEVGEETFNRISVDGNTSPNDTVLLLANGLCGNRPIVSTKEKAFGQFERALRSVMEELAKKIVADGEGATLMAQVIVKNARTREEALKVCEEVATSSLVKTALFGRDSNWGRIAASVGASGVPFRPERLSIALGDVWFFRKGTPVPSAGRFSKGLFKQNPFRIQIDLGRGREEASMWTCDLTDDYVRFNAHYRT